MGISIWLFMWLDDKITKIDDKGVGWVLGGKPIKYEEYIKPELGISLATYTRWVKILSSYPYIKAIRTPYGISFRVFKAHKNFKKRLIKSEESKSSLVRNLYDKNEESNKTIPVDNNNKTIEALPLWINKDAWNAWLKYNKEKKKKMPPSTIQFQLNKLEKFKKDHTEMIYQSIERGYSGLFPIKKDYSRSDAGRVLQKREEDEAQRERSESVEDSEARKKILGDIKNLALEKSVK